MRKGVRWIDGREFLLCGRKSWQADAKTEAKALRQSWTLVRVIKLSEFDYLLYVHGEK